MMIGRIVQRSSVAIVAHSLLVTAAIAVWCPASPVYASSIYDLDSQITFNVLERVEYNPKNGKIALIGHRDTAYNTSKIPYLEFLATLLDNPTPEFSLEWTPDSERRVEELHKRLSSESTANKLIDEWGTWIDGAGNVTPTGRSLAEIFGISLSSSDIVNSRPNVDRYEFLSGMFAVIGDYRASRMMSLFGKIHRSSPNVSREHFADLIAAANIADDFKDAMTAVKDGKISLEQGLIRTYRAFFASLDLTFVLANAPTTKAFSESIARGDSSAAGMQTGLQEFDRQFQAIYKRARTQLWESKQEVHIPLTDVDPALRDTIKIAPKYIGLDGNSLLAKLLFEIDFFGKHLIHMPQLADRIPGYQTKFMFDRTHPEALTKLAPGESTDQTERFWFSVDHVDASRSTDGNILVIHDAVMRINNRLRGPDGKDLPNQGPTEYENLLTSHYDDFARAFPDLFHTMREAAKLTYAAQWLKAKNPKLKMPKAGREAWNGPRELSGIIYVIWSPTLTSTVEVTGGASLRIPSVNNPVPIDRQVKPQSGGGDPNAGGLSLNPKTWTGCNAGSGLFGHVGHCGQPDFEPATPPVGTPAAAKQPNPAPTPSLPPLPSLPPPAAWSGTSSPASASGPPATPPTPPGSIGTATAPDSPPPPPPGPPPKSSSSGCTPRAGTAFFNIQANPDPSVVDLGCNDASQPVPLLRQPDTLPPAQPPTPPLCEALNNDIDALNEVKQRASLAEHVYLLYGKDAKGNARPPAGFTLLDENSKDMRYLLPGVTPERIRELLAPSDSDFRAAIYLKDGQIYLVFRGTQSRKDWEENVRQGTGEPSQYYQKAMELAAALAPHAGRLVIIGHSLGGGLAAAAGMRTADILGPNNVQVTTFNSASVHPNTKAYPNANQFITNYVVPGEPLNGYQDQRYKVVIGAAVAAGLIAPVAGPYGGFLPAWAGTQAIGNDALPSAVGRRVMLPSQWPQVQSQSIIDRYIFPSLFDRHSMTSVREALAQRARELDRQSRAMCPSRVSGEVPVPPVQEPPVEPNQYVNPTLRTVDFLSSVIPVMSTVRVCADAATGQNVVTGAALSSNGDWAAKSFCVVGLGASALSLLRGSATLTEAAIEDPALEFEFMKDYTPNSGAALGRGRDLDRFKLPTGEYRLGWFDVRDTLGDQANWAINEAKLRDVMKLNLPIRDVSGVLARGPYLDRERALLRAAGWLRRGDRWLPPGSQ
jgi:hypothetical protein